MSESVVSGGVSHPKAPVHLWIIGIVTLLWNGFGIFDWVATVTRFEPYLSNFPQDQLDYFYSFPAWMFAVWAVGVGAGFLGSVGLLVRRSWAVWMFILSLLAVVVSTVCSFTMAEPPESMQGPATIIMPIVIAAIAVFLVLYSRKMAAKGVLR